jgi:hypothetical protein
LLYSYVVHPSKIIFIYCRWSEGPKVKGLEPIVVIFLEKKDKEAVWLKIREGQNLINQLSYPGMDNPPTPLPLCH